MNRRLSPAGLIVAVIGFGLTRVTVTFTVGEQPLRFAFAGVVPLTLGLTLSAFGVALTVGSFDRRYVRTTALWTVIGTATMFLLVVLTLMGSGVDEMGEIAGVQWQPALSNFLIGGAIGGALTGIYAAENRRQRGELKQQTDRLEILNRSLRDRVLNAVLVIDGQIGILSERDDPELQDRVVETVQTQSNGIQRTVEDVKHLARTTESARRGLDAMDVTTTVDRAVDTVSEEVAQCSYEVQRRPNESVTVWGNEMLVRAIEHVLRRGTDRDNGPTQVSIAIEYDDRFAHLRITDDGAALTNSQRAILEEGTSGDYDDPASGFGLNVVRLVLDTIGGHAETSDDGETTTIDLAIPLASTGTHPGRSTVRAADSFGVSRVEMGMAVVASLVAGVTMGVVGQATSGVVPIIGSLYGSAQPLVGWITHEFHSVVFGLMYAGILASVPDPYAEDVRWCLAVGMGWAIVLWLVAAGVIMPLWLRLVGEPAMLPSLSLPSLLTHLIWGATMSVLYIGGRTLMDRETASSD
ncbi:Signal transduction histidine kinase, contains PAS domain [Halorhabdus sp. SVX81]|uniref:sensor histidine kinase n=1 Tax=Halorhabdus sp. SVX81 TaxID=2978283 RepID=UPI0023DCB7E3|nr:ATP-binding protein [Halorhabdus sp. SVX81]WEL16875.1 Signal transduction histidine kinase, contains PAS domain [Halorhabdus sp. SVX81]